MRSKDGALKPGDALILVDVQRDFLPGGALAVPRGHEVIPPLNALIRLFEEEGLPVFASRDWHPPDHSSFKEHGGIWEPHCVAESEGAAFPDELELPDELEVISKATEHAKDAYSCFEGTDLERRLKEMGVKRVFIGGLATEYCVLNSVRDAAQAGLEVIVIEDAIRPIREDAADWARRRMEKAGARFARSVDVSRARAA